MRYLLSPLLLAALLFGCNRPVGVAEPFPEGFIWGAGNAAYEGVRINDAHAQALSAIGLSHYRMSLDWAALMPDGQTLDKSAMDSVRAELDALDRQGIAAVLVLYQGGMPETLASQGGWSSTESPRWFAHYAQTVFGELSGRAAMWVTIADPFRDRLAAHPAPVPEAQETRDVSNAPPFVQARRAARALNPEQSTRELLRTRLTEMHHMVLAHAAAMGASPDAPAGLIVGAAPVIPVDPDVDADAARLEDAYRNQFLISGVLGRGYPKDLLSVLDLRLTAPSTRLDFLGLDYFSPVRVRADPSSQHMGVRLIPNMDGDRSAFGEADARSLHAVLTSIADRYDNPAVYVTGNGAAYGPIDEINDTGRVRDELRVRFLRRHLVRAQLAAADGVDLRGYFVWSAFDSPSGTPSGIIAFDPETGQPVYKDSARYLRSIAAANAVSRMPF